MNEEAPVNNVGSGNVAGVGVGPNGEPGFKKKKTVMLKRLGFKEFVSKK